MFTYFFFYFDLLILYVMSLATFALWGWDKHCAVNNRGRVPEWLLLLMTFLGGAFGALCGMIFFKHKTHKTLFLVLVTLLTIVQVFGVALLRIFLLSLNSVN